MGKKGTRSQPGVGEIWDEPKSVMVTVKMTPTGKKLLDDRSQEMKISRGELIERYLRGAIAIPEISAADQEALRLASNTPLRAMDVVRSLPSFKLVELAQVIQAAGRLLGEKLLPSKKQSIARLFEGMNLEELSQQAEIPLDRLAKIAEGDKPTPQELSQLEAPLSMPLEVLQEICDRTFPATAETVDESDE